MQNEIFELVRSAIESSVINIKDLSGNYPDTKYFKEKHDKTQIFIHHTVSGPGIEGDLATWKSLNGIGTSFIIERDGTINMMFDPQYYAYHLGLKQKYFSAFNLPYKALDKTSIGIELDSWGGLIKDAVTSRMYNAYGGVVKSEYIQYDDPYRGYKYYERYTAKQLFALGLLVRFLCVQFNIPNPKIDTGIGTEVADYFRLSEKALKGDPGVYFHSNVRQDKSDCHPQPELFNELFYL